MRTCTKTWLAVVVGGFFLVTVSLAQTSPATSPNPQTQPANPQTENRSATPPSPATNQTPNALKIAPGSVIPVQLTKSVDAKKAKSGDQVEAKVTQDLKAGNGELVVPKDTKILGHVTEAQARNKEDKESQLGLAFDHAVIQNGNDIHLPMSIQAVIAPARPDSGNNGPNGASSSQVPEPSSGGGSSSARPNGMGGGGSTPPTPPATSQASAPTTGQPTANAHAQITGSTQGVLGFSNLKLSTGSNAGQGSVLTSEKGNVKLDSGTIMLLRVSQ